MNMFARFDENPAMTLQVIKETGVTDGRTDNVKTVYPLQTKFAGGIIKHILFYHIWGLQPFWSSLMNTPSNSPVISEKPMFR